MVTQSGSLSKDALPQQAFDSAMSVADTAGHHTIALLAAIAASLRPGSTVTLYEPMQVTAVPVPGIDTGVCHCLCLQWSDMMRCSSRMPAINMLCPAGDVTADNPDPLQAAAFGRLHRNRGSRFESANQDGPCNPHCGELCPIAGGPLAAGVCLGANPPCNMARWVVPHGAGCLQCQNCGISGRPGT